MKTAKEAFKIRPSARILSTIGEDIIKDIPAAIVELVKNSYDADAKEVSILFYTTRGKQTNKSYLKILIKDDGHGMNYDTVTTKWLVPATDDKLIRRFSPEGRKMQGRKGIGRYATAILGDKLSLETIDKEKNKTEININWKTIKQSRFLDEIEVDVNTAPSDEPSGTSLLITGNAQQLTEWTKNEIELLIQELRKLLSPFENQNFKITLEFKNFSVSEYQNFKTDIEPYPLIELYDYRLHGYISSTGSAVLTYENKYENGLRPERMSLKFKLGDGKPCGRIKLDLRVFDREPESILNLINKGLRDPITGNYLNRRAARRLLDEISGIYVYRHNFRIRPYGEQGYDWLELDRRRVQNPSLKIGSNQIVGIVTIQSEEDSHLEEKSARDGIKENKYYTGLKEYIKDALSILEERRYVYREKTGRSRKAALISEELNKLFDFDNLFLELQRLEDKKILDAKEVQNLRNKIEKTQQNKAKVYEEISNIIAIYEGQATLGKILSVVLHEGRKPLNWFKNQAPLLIGWANDLKLEVDKSILDKLIDRLGKSSIHSNSLINLFERLDPLAAKKRSKKREIKVRSLLEDVMLIFENELKVHDIEYSINCDKDISCCGWEQDFYMALTNMAENSIYWLSNSAQKERQIKICVECDKDIFLIDFIDNGPGIKKDYIESGVIFNPGFSAKPNGGTGLGLAIAGEALERSGYTLKALYSEKGAYFRIEYSKELDINE